MMKRRKLREDASWLHIEVIFWEKKTDVGLVLLSHKNQIRGRNIVGENIFCLGSN